jgi:hypothetical protein
LPHALQYHQGGGQLMVPELGDISSGLAAGTCGFLVAVAALGFGLPAHAGAYICVVLGGRTDADQQFALCGL